MVCLLSVFPQECQLQNLRAQQKGKCEPPHSKTGIKCKVFFPLRSLSTFLGVFIYQVM